MRSLRMHLQCGCPPIQHPDPPAASIASLTVIHTSSAPLYRESYARLAAREQQGEEAWRGRVRFLEEEERGGSFAALLDGALAGLDEEGKGEGADDEHFVMWVVDDLLLFDDVDVAGHMRALAEGECPEAAAFAPVWAGRDGIGASAPLQLYHRSDMCTGN